MGSSKSKNIFVEYYDGNKIRYAELKQIKEPETVKSINMDGFSYFFGMKKIDGINRFTNLKYLSCKLNNLESLEGFEKLTKLKSINISYNSIKSLEPLTKLPKLEVLYFHDNKFKLFDDISFFSKFKKLKRVNKFVFGNTKRLSFEV